MKEWDVERWISDADIQSVEYSRYWNDEQEEKAKAWYVLDGDFARMEEHLTAAGLVDDLARCLNTLKKERPRGLEGRGIDLAAGNLWAAAHLVRLEGVEKLYCLEFSRHRLLTIGPVVLAHYGVPPEKITLVQGSFLDLHLADA